MAKWLQGKKVYILAALTAVGALVEFLAKGDYSLTAIWGLAQGEGFAALIAALRAAITKSGPTS